MTSQYKFQNSCMQRLNQSLGPVNPVPYNHAARLEQKPRFHCNIISYLFQILAETQACFWPNTYHRRRIPFQIRQHAHTTTHNPRFVNKFQEHHTVHSFISHHKIDSFQIGVKLPCIHFVMWSPYQCPKCSICFNLSFVQLYVSNQ